MKFSFRLVFYFALLTQCFTLNAGVKSDEMIIEVPSFNSLTPVYIDSSQLQSAEVAQSYLQSLQEVLLFDFSYNGRTKVVAHKEIDSLKLNRSASDWKALGIAYVIKPAIRDDYLTLSVLSTREDKICYAEDIKITQDLSVDRKKIHIFAYRLHKQLFNEEGIYLNKILYSYKAKNVADPYYESVHEEVFQCDWDGTNPTQMTFEKSHCVSPYPASLNRDTEVDGFFYVSYKLGQPKIFWARFSGGAPQRLTYIPGNQFMPAMSLKGDMVAFINDAPGYPEVFVQEFRPGVGSIGKPRQVSSFRKGVQSSPTFSPDGKRIAFVSDKDGSPRIYMMKIPDLSSSASDIHPVLLTKKNAENTKPSWSPDGTKIAYIARSNGVRQVWIYDFITKEESQLTFSPGNKENPQWAFNSLHLVFNSVGNDTCELYLVNLNQPDVVRIKPTAGVKRFPVWVKKDK